MMSKKGNSNPFDAYYFAHSCGRPYQRDEYWLNFFDGLADRIVSDLQPKSVMDAGCAMGFLVEAFRGRGIEAFGIDISTYAIEQVIPEIKPYCWVASILDPFPLDYDLIVCIEVLEHLEAAEATKAIMEICQHSERVLFSSTPFDHKETTHKNVQPTEYWVEHFARQGFYRDVDYDASYINPWAILFEKQGEISLRIIRDYERKFWQLWKANIDLRELSLETQNRLAENEGEIDLFRQQMDEQSQELEVLKELYEKRLNEKEGSIQNLQLRVEDRIQEIRKLKAEMDILDQSIKAYRESAVLSDQRIQGLRAEVEKRERNIHEWREQVEAEAKRSNYFQQQLKAWEERWNDLERGAGWKLLHTLRVSRMKIIPKGSRRERSYYWLLEKVGVRHRGNRVPDINKLGASKGSDSIPNSVDVDSTPKNLIREQSYRVEEIGDMAPIQFHVVDVDIIICVHNALDDVKECLESVIKRTTPPFHLIIVDDGSESATERFLVDFSIYQGATLIRNDEALGYTRAANQGIEVSTADLVVLLNSDTIVTDEWLDRMINCADSDPNIGIVGPLSNSASWQSIPEIFEGDDWARNPPPSGVNIADIGNIVAKYSARIYPRMPLLNGFCLLIKRGLLEDIGHFDEEWFGDGYGEEDDFVIRAQEVGWGIALADDAYVYHSQSKSYSHQTRQELTRAAGLRLLEKHGQQIVQESVSFCRENRVLNGIRARSRVMYQRQNWVKRGKEQFAGKRLLFLLPIAEPGGGGNVVIDEANAMREMDVEVELFNLQSNEEGFLNSYPHLELPIRFGAVEELSDICSKFDAVCATVYFSVDWLSSISNFDKKPILGYYIQGFEPLIYQPGTPEYLKAFESYTQIPEMVKFTKTQWNRDIVLNMAGVDSRVVGPSTNIDLFRPRPTETPAWQARPLHIAAMVRPSTVYRQPNLTLEVLKRAIENSSYNMEIVLFGAAPNDPEFLKLPLDFPWRNAGIISQHQVARLMNDVDIFIDLSYHQAMGLTAMEAMACGVAVIVPEYGGATGYVNHGENGLVVNTNSFEACRNALHQLIVDHQMRSKIQDNALRTICSFYPEKPAYEILYTLFNDAGE